MTYLRADSRERSANDIEETALPNDGEAKCLGMSSNLQLSQEQQCSYLAFIEASIRVSSHVEFTALIRDHVEPLLPHGVFIAGIGRIMPDFRIQVFQLLPANYPLEYLSSVQRPGGGIQSPIMTRWAKTQLPQLYEPSTDKGADIDHEWLAIYERYALGNQVAHGLHDLFSDVTSYFSFCRVHGSPTAWHEYLLRLLVPHLHLALLQALIRKRRTGSDEAPKTHALTPREKQLLALLLSGKTNSEIAETLCRSEKTIKNQLHTLYRKLGVSTRAQAICRANEAYGERFDISTGHSILPP
jgi:LuxR family transcriptional regulator, quorum-sensing system regulator CviR